MIGAVPVLKVGHVTVLDWDKDMENEVQEYPVKKAANYIEKKVGTKSVSFAVRLPDPSPKHPSGPGAAQVAAGRPLRRIACTGSRGLSSTLDTVCRSARALLQLGYLHPAPPFPRNPILDLNTVNIYTAENAQKHNHFDT